ncbi:hypothetical protein OS42_47480 [Dickeya oryzae]
MGFAVNGQMQFSPDTAAFFAVFLTFHSPSPKTFSPVESITQCAISPRVGVFKLTLTDFAHLLTQL